MRALFLVFILGVISSCAGGSVELAPDIAFANDRALDYVIDSNVDNALADFSVNDYENDNAVDTSSDTSNDDSNLDAIGCVLGTVDNCLSCGDRCPGQSSANTKAVCKSGGCDIECLDEYYDVNGDPNDGCESVDDLPIHNSESVAKDLGGYDDCDDSYTVEAFFPSDDRVHIKLPYSRSLGIDDVYKTHIDDDILCIVNASVKVDFKDFAADNLFEVTLSYRCDTGKTLEPKIAEIRGGTSGTLVAPTNCDTISDDSGTLYIFVDKKSGSHSDKAYYLTIEP